MDDEMMSELETADVEVEFDAWSEDGGVWSCDGRADVATANGDRTAVVTVEFYSDSPPVVSTWWLGSSELVRGELARTIESQAVEHAEAKREMVL